MEYYQECTQAIHVSVNSNELQWQQHFQWRGGQLSFLLN